jgi:hypothetical protein
MTALFLGLSRAGFGTVASDTPELGEFDEILSRYGEPAPGAIAPA